MNTTCLVCDTPTSTRCARCKSVYYCSAAHITQDWPAHKPYCKRVSAAGTNTFDVILFGVNETKPRLIKLPWSYVVDEDVGTRWQMLDHKLWFNDENLAPRTIPPAPRNMFVQTFGTNGPPLGRNLTLIYDDNFLINGAPTNQCIQNVTRGKATHPWAGNVLALRGAEEAAFYSGADHYSDVVVEEDLGPLIRYLEEYGE